MQHVLCDHCGVLWPADRVSPVISTNYNRFYHSVTRYIFCLPCLRAERPETYEKRMRLREKREQQRDDDLAERGIPLSVAEVDYYPGVEPPRV